MANQIKVEGGYSKPLEGKPATFSQKCVMHNAYAAAIDHCIIVWRASHDPS